MPASRSRPAPTSRSPWPRAASTSSTSTSRCFRGSRRPPSGTRRALSSRRSTRPTPAPSPTRSRDRTRDRYRARIDALVATSPQAAAAAAQIYPGEYTIVPAGISEQFQPGTKTGTRIAAEWSSEGRPALRALVKLVAAAPGSRARTGLEPAHPPADAPVRPGGRARPGARAKPQGHGRAGRRDPRCRRVRRRARRRRRPGMGGAGMRLRGRLGAAARVARAARSRPRVRRRPAGARRGGRRAPHRRQRRFATTSRAGAGRPPRSALRGGRAAARGGVRRPRQAAARCTSGRRSRTARRSWPTCTCTRTTPTIARPTRRRCSTTASPRGSARLRSPTTTRSRARSRRPRLGKPITVIVGEEVKTSQGEVIGLFLHERIERGMSMDETITAIQDQGGLVYMPHPFDRMHTIPDPATLLRVLDRIDIFEVYNSRLLFDAFNDDAMRFAAKYNLIQAAGSDAHVLPGHRHGAEPDPRVRRARGVPARDAPEPDRPPPEEPPVSSGAEVGSEREQVEASGARRRIRRWVNVAEDQIYERYQAKAIAEINALGHDIAEWLREAHPGAAPVLGTGHPLADILLLKYAPLPAEAQEGVAFFGRAGQAILKSLQRMRIDPLDALRDRLPEGRGRAGRRRSRALPHVAHARDPHHPAAHGRHDGRRRPGVPRLDRVPAVGARRGPGSARSSSGRRRSSSSTRPTSTSASTALRRSSSSGRRSRCSAPGTRTCRPTER